MEKFIPPTDFFKFKEMRKEININEVKTKLTDNKELGCSFLTLYLSNPLTATELTIELSRIFPKSYRQKTYRILTELVALGVINFKKFSDVNQNNPTELEKKIIRKHEAFMATITNPWGNSYEHMVYYSLSNRGFEVLEHVAKKYKFSKIEE